MLERIRNHIEARLVDYLILVISFIASIKIYEYETARRLAQGMNPSPGSEVILPFMVIGAYFFWKGFWEGIKEFKENDWYV